jgi:hypothetical protein
MSDEEGGTAGLALSAGGSLLAKLYQEEANFKQLDVYGLSKGRDYQRVALSRTRATKSLHGGRVAAQD